MLRVDVLIAFLLVPLNHNASTTVIDFSNAGKGILFCIDVGARGLHIPGVDWVVQYDPPGAPKDYIHRVGRTARGEGAKGNALLFLIPEELLYLSYLKVGFLGNAVDFVETTSTSKVLDSKRRQMMIAFHMRCVGFIMAKMVLRELMDPLIFTEFKSFLTKYKLCKVRSVQIGQKGIPYLNTYDGRTIRYPDPLIKANDTIKFDLEANKIVDFVRFDVGNVVMVTGGRNRGRVGVIKNREKHKGSFETIHIEDFVGHEFATRQGNVFIIGKGTKPWVSVPKGKGIKLSIIEEARKRQQKEAAVSA